MKVGFSQSLNPYSEIDSLLLMAEEEISERPPAANTLIHRAIQLSNKQGYSRGLADAFSQLANLHYLKGHYDSSIHFGRKSLNLSILHSESTLQAKVYVTLGKVHSSKGNKDSTFYFLYKALVFYEHSGDSLRVSRVYNCLAEMYSLYGEHTKALIYLAKAETIFIKLNALKDLATTYETYGVVYYYLENNQKAIQYVKKAMVLHANLKLDRYLANDWNQLAACYQELNLPDSVLVYYSRAMRYYESKNLKSEMGEILFNIGVYYYNKEKTDSALQYFEKALMIEEQAGDIKLKMRILPLLAETYSIVGKADKAYNSMLRYSQLNDSLLNKEKVKQIAEMQTKYETGKKEQEIRLLGEQNKTQKAQRNFLIAGSLVLLFLLLAFGIYFIQRTRIAKKNEVIAREKISSLLKEQEIKTYNAMLEGQEEERKRIATDLHDRLGSMLSTVKLLFGALDEKIDKNQAENKKQYEKASDILDEAVIEVRRISHNLNTGMLNNFGLVMALDELCESINNSKLIRCRLLSFGEGSRLEQQIEIGIFRMVQEIVNNTLKHANASELTVQLNQTEESILVTTEDDGIGFDVETKRKSGGMGLANLEARALKINGFVQIDSTPGRGTITTIEIPLRHV